MKRKFAVAAATAALITASLSFTAFAAAGDPPAGADLTVADPANAKDDQKDNVVVTVNPAGDEITTKSGKYIDDGFIKIDGKVYFVDATSATAGKLEAVTDKFYTVSDDAGTPTSSDDGTKTVYLENGKVVAAKIVKADGKEKVLNVAGDAFVTATATTGAEIKTVTLKSGNTTTTVDYLIAEDGHIVKGWEELSNVTTIGNAGDPATVASSKQWFYAKADGTPVKNTWVSTTAGRWFFIGGNGVLVTATNADAASSDEAKLAGDGWTVASVGADSATIAKDGKTYIIDKTGLWVTGWTYDVQNKDWYYYNETTANGWVKLGTKWIYLTNYKAAQDEVKHIGNDDYAFDKDCYMITGFGKVTVDPDGIAQVADGDEYVANVYANAKGVLQSGYQTIDGVDYYFEANNSATVAKYAATKGIHASVKDLDGDAANDDIMTDSFGKVIADWWIKLNDNWYYVNDKKVLVKNDWVKYGKNAKCFMGPDGVMVEGGVYVLTNAGKIDFSSTSSFVGDDASKADHLVVNTQTGIALENLLNGSVVINEAGAAVTKYGWVVLTRDKDNNVTWGFADKNGKAYHGWVSDNGKWYYINAGKLVTDSIVEGKYYVDENGVWTSGKTK